MAYFPFFMDLEEMKGLVVGGGRIATHKVKLLLAYNPILYVVAPEISSELAELIKENEGQNRIGISARAFEMEDLEQMDFVVAASDDASLNAFISRKCKARKIPVNVVDVKDECSFIFPSLVQEGAISIGISTSGNSPWMAKYLKEKVREAIPKGFAWMSQELGRWRPYVKEKVSSQKQREKIFTAMAETILTKEEEEFHFEKEEIDQLICQACLSDCSDIPQT